MKNIFIRYSLTILFFLLLIAGNTYGQKTTTLILEYQKDNWMADSFFYHMMKPLQSESFGEPFLYRDTLISYTRTDSLCKSIAQINVQDTTCGFIFELFGHEIFVIPGDTINLKSTPYIKPDSLQKTVFPSRHPGVNTFSFSGKNKYCYEFFDSLTMKAGDLRFDYINFRKTDSLLTFFDKVTNYYIFRKDFLDNYSQRHHLLQHFYELALAELNSAYFINLCSPFHNGFTSPDKYPAKYRYALDNCIFDNEYLYFHTALYKDYALEIAGYKVRRSIQNSNNIKDIDIELYKFLKDRFSGNLRDHLLTKDLSTYPFQSLPTSYDSLLNDYQKVCRNENYKNYIIDVAKKNSAKIKELNLLGLNDALGVDIVDTLGRKFLLKKILSPNKPTIIDCWATWCGPCMKQMPFEREFEKEYKGRVNFIYLSFDRNQKDWKSGSNKGLINNYFLSDGFNSNFARYFKINAIPRYIVVDRMGKIVSADTYQPSMKTAFAKMLLDLIKA